MESSNLNSSRFNSVSSSPRKQIFQNENASCQNQFTRALQFKEYRLKNHAVRLIGVTMDDPEKKQLYENYI